VALTSKERQALVAESHRLKPAVTLAAGEVTQSVVAHVQAAFTGRALIKVRINADLGEECDATAAALAQQVPCEIVKRIGRVVLLYRAPASA
jgi:putative YhbY family RNA-binding protein